MDADLIIGFALASTGLACMGAGWLLSVTRTITETHHTTTTRKEN